MTEPLISTFVEPHLASAKAPTSGLRCKTHRLACFTDPPEFAFERARDDFAFARARRRAFRAEVRAFGELDYGVFDRFRRAVLTASAPDFAGDLFFSDRFERGCAAADREPGFFGARFPFEGAFGRSDRTGRVGVVPFFYFYTPAVFRAPSFDVREGLATADRN